MAENFFTRPAQARSVSSSYDEGLRKHMLRVYNYVAGGLALNGALAYFIVSSPSVFQAIQPFSFVAMIVAIGISLFIGFRGLKVSFATAQMLFWAYSASLSVITAMYLAAYDPMSVARAFFVTASIFAGMSLYGYTTKRDLTSIGQFLMIGLIGVFFGAIINFFVGSAMISFVITAAFTVILIGLIAYDTQKLRDMYYQVPDSETKDKLAVYGALTLFSDFIFLFYQMLQLLGSQR